MALSHSRFQPPAMPEVAYSGTKRWRFAASLRVVHPNPTQHVGQDGAAVIVRVRAFAPDVGDQSFANSRICRFATNGSRSELPIANADPLVSGQFFQAHRTAGADFVRADADFRAHPEFGAVGETRRSVPIDGRGVHLGQELFCATLVCRDDAV